jgi:hypothetical protein
LTGTPEITFFKVVYRRHTNFSMESVKVDFDDQIGFGRKSSLTVPKVGDLIHKTYIEIELPEMDLMRMDANEDCKADVSEAEANFQIVLNFMNLNRRAYVEAHDICIAENNNDSSKIIDAINMIFNDVAVQDIIDDFETLLDDTDGNPFTYVQVSMQGIIGNFGPMDDKDVICDALKVGIDKSIKTQKFFFNDLVSKRNKLLDQSDENIKFAWVDRVGHAIIEEIEVRIGGQVIDRHFGDWLNIWYELSGNKDMEDIYKKLIGDVEILTSFDRNSKPMYKLRVPLQFWFCRFSGLSIPLVALEYHDVTFHVKFRKLEEVSYIEEGKMIKYYEDEEGFFLDELVEQLDIDIKANLLIDYIYLDGNERRKFARSSHEYLIDQLQILTMEGVTQQNVHFVLNNFVHPSKELIWVSQRESFTENLNCSTKTRWDNYSLTTENKGNPIKISGLEFHGYTRALELDGNYFNYVQPYLYHNATPSDGINVFSFSLFPEEFQPSGSANLSRLSRIVLNLMFSDVLFDDGVIIDPMNIRVYTRNHNILRFISGMGGTAWTYG